LVNEILSRHLRDGKAVARYAGLTGSPDESGKRRREKGLARAGNARVRLISTMRSISALVGCQLLPCLFSGLGDLADFRRLGVPGLNDLTGALDFRFASRHMIPRHITPSLLRFRFPCCFTIMTTHTRELRSSPRPRVALGWRHTKNSAAKITPLARSWSQYNIYVMWQSLPFPRGG
jgi:Transposase IS116/IS110/IS902 family